MSKIGSYVQQEILPTLKGDIIGGISVTEKQMDAAREMLRNAE